MSRRRYPSHIARTISQTAPSPPSRWKEKRQKFSLVGVLIRNPIIMVLIAVPALAGPVEFGMAEVKRALTERERPQGR